MFYRVLITCVLCLGILGGCQSNNLASLRSQGIEITRIQVMKEQHKMYLLAGNDIVKTYDIDLGFAPVGDKKIKGDGKTPEGVYYIDRKNPKSKYFLSLGISYPNARDRAEARQMGKDPGGDIFIHGQPNFFAPPGRDWTAGCIAITNPEMKELFNSIALGTQIVIFP